MSAIKKNVPMHRKVSTMKVEVKRKLFWYVRLVAANGEVLLHSEVYFNKSNAQRAAKKLKEYIK